MGKHKAELDQEELQMRAARVGVPYQTYIASSLHKLVSGQLREVEQAPGIMSWSRPPWPTRQAHWAPLLHVKHPEGG